MANLSNQTRKEQVLRKLQQSPGEWIDGPMLANVVVGGSEGLKRLRELRLEGYPIEMRKHPDPDRDIWQYRLSEPQNAESGGVIRSLKGVDLGSVKKCPLCLGKTKVIDNRNPGHKWIACPRCLGTGYVTQ